MMIFHIMHIFILLHLMKLEGEEILIHLNF